MKDASLKASPSLRGVVIDKMCIRDRDYLDADIKNSDLSEYVSQVLIPTEKVYQVRNGKKLSLIHIFHRWLDSDLISNIILIFQTKTNTLYFSSIT